MRPTHGQTDSAKDRFGEVGHLFVPVGLRELSLDSSLSGHIWSYKAEYGPSMKKKSFHINMDPRIDEILEAIRNKMEDPLYPKPSKSDLLNKAALLFIEECKKRDSLREVAEEIEKKHAAMEKLSEQSPKVVRFNAKAKLAKSTRARRATRPR